MLTFLYYWRKGCIQMTVFLHYNDSILQFSKTVQDLHEPRSQTFHRNLKVSGVHLENISQIYLNF